MPNQIEKRLIGSKEEWKAWRRRDVTASVIGALFGVHRYKTVYDLWNDVTGTAPPPLPQNVELMERGTEFEEAVANIVRREHPEWRIKKARHYYRDPALRMGATPDYLMTNPVGQRGILQVKIVNRWSFNRYWTETVAPQWIVLQTLTEMILTRSTWGMIVAYEWDDNRHRPPHYYEVPRNLKAEQRLKNAVVAFWRAIDAGEIPKPDYVRDGALIAAMYPHAKPGSVVDLRHDNRMPEILDARAQLKAEIAEKAAALEALENEIKDKVGENEIALVRGWTVKLKEIKETVVKEYVRNAYRRLDVKRDEAKPEPEPKKDERAA